MLITTNDHRTFNDTYNLITIENNMIFGKYPYNKAKHDHNILVVTTNTYNKILEDIKEIIKNG